MDGRYSKWLCFYMALSFEYGLLLQIRSFPYIWATLGTLGIWGACQFFSFLGGIHAVCCSIVTDPRDQYKLQCHKSHQILQKSLGIAE
jgi:hypothetical protein